jgi:hypothetical protein
LPTYDHGLISSANYTGKDSKGNATFKAGDRSNAFQLPVAQAVT